MTDQQKKIVQIIVIIVCFAVGGGLIVNFLKSSGTAGLTGEQLMMCTNPDCGASYYISNEKYFDMLQKKDSGEAVTSIPGVTCKECGQETLYPAKKCVECGAVFVPDYNTEGAVEIYRCPKCR